eukprot:TRINITY_DN16542_c0_g1_i3.p1 TRINITY_DN16542_c0_g1~~TRINITY_DN16542_c0_g1_i3.p1  ORF type:complete len:788 (+),score=168.65 TRINITY_DN16542_c0_g1_i3:78-2441(+)
MIRRPPRSTLSSSSAASDVYKRQVLTQVLSGMRLVLHPLNKKGLQPLRSLLAERMLDQRRRELGVDQSKDFEEFSKNGFVLRDLDTVDRDGLAELLRMASGEAQVPLPKELKWIERNTTHEANDPQYDLHQDTFSGAYKVWAFPGDTVIEHGPLNYVKGSHRNTEGRLEWIQHASLEEAAVAEPSLRFHPRESAPKGFEPAIPVLPLPNTKWTLVVADTSGMHCRGQAPPGALRRSLRLFGDNDGGIPRLNPFRELSALGQLQLKGGNTDSGKLYAVGQDGQWRAVLTSKWGKQEADATCKQLGFYTAFQVMTYDTTNVAEDQPRFSFNCQGGERSLVACQPIQLADTHVCTEPLIEVGVSCISGKSSTDSVIPEESMSAELARRTVKALDKFKSEQAWTKLDNLGVRNCTLAPSIEKMLTMINESAYVFSDQVVDHFVAHKQEIRKQLCMSPKKAALVSGMLREGMRVTALGVDISKLTFPALHPDLRGVDVTKGVGLASKLYRPLLDADFETVREVFLSQNQHHPVHWHLDQPLRNAQGSWLDLTDSEYDMYTTLQRDGFLYINDFGLTEAELDELMATADNVISSTDQRVTSAVSDGAVVTSRLHVPILDERVAGNTTIQKVVRSYLGNETTLNGYKLTRLHGLNSTDQYIASQWHHDRAGRRLKMFVYLHDVDCEQGHPTLVVLGTQNVQYFKTETFPFSRFTDEYVNSHFKVAKACGKKGSGFLFDTHTVHKATVMGAHDRTTAIFEFHNSVKCSIVEKAEMGIPCPSGDQFLVNRLLDGSR